MSDDNVSMDEKLNKLSVSIPNKTLHQYKTFNTQYIQWLQKNNLINGNGNGNDFKYDELPLDSILIHRFLLDNVITKITSFSNKFLILLKSYIKSFIFLNKICNIYRPDDKQQELDTSYLDHILNIHTHWFEINDQTLILPTLSIISYNSWNPYTPHLNKKNFKSSLEKLRFLIDYQLMTYLGANYPTRSSLKLLDLKCNDLNKLMLLCNFENDNEPARYLLPQLSPFLCPFTTLATYLFFKFYGVINVSKGDGFPNLFNEEYVESMTIISGRQIYNYPKEATLNNGYIAMFKYCNQPYKKKFHFDKILFEYPNLTDQQITQLQNETNFQDGIPFDFMTIFNWKNPYQPYNQFLTKDFFKERSQVKPPDSIIFKFFPEIEFYKQKKNYHKLSQVSKDLLKTLELLRLVMVSNLPIIHKTFPDHELFKNEIFEDTDILSFLNDSIFTVNDYTTNILPFKKLQNLTNEQLLKQLIEMPTTNTSQPATDLVLTQPTNTQDTPVISINDDMLDEFRKQNFQFVQFQTLSNFKTLISFLTKIFNNMSIKKSSKETISRQLALLNDSIIERINNSTPKDIKDYFLKKELIKHKSDQVVQYNDTVDKSMNENESESEFMPQPRLLADSDVSNSFLDDSQSDEDDDDNLSSDSESMQEELKIMVEQFVTSKVDKIVSQQLNNFENKLEYMVESLVEEKIENKLKNIDFTKYMSKRKASELDLDDSLQEDIDQPPMKLQRMNPYKKIIENSKYTIKNRESLVSANEHSQSTPKQQPVIHPVQTRGTSPIVSTSLSNRTFYMKENISSIDDVILEWFTPNPEMDNQCVHSMNKTHNKSWRTAFESLYKQRKQIVEFYVYLINTLQYDRYKAIDICNDVMEKNDLSLTDFSKFLKSWKKNHYSSFDGII